MTKFIVSKASENGFDQSFLETEDAGVGFKILNSEFDDHFDQWVSENTSAFIKGMLDDNKVCFKTEIASIKHPLQFKTEIEKIRVRIPFNGWIITDGRPRVYQRDVKYAVIANICYPVDLVVSHVERCAKQGAIAAAAIALSGSLTATQAAFQVAFLACMAAADFPDADKISIQVTGDTEHGEWHPV